VAGDSHDVPSGHPSLPNNVAAAMLAYDVPHKAPWGLPVSAYVWTKAIAAGSYLVGAFSVLTGWDRSLWEWTVPMVSAVFLAITFILLIADLEHPKRFYMILTRPQWRSWIVRGAFILGGFAAILGMHLLWSFFGDGPPRAFALVGALFALASGTYTAWLFGQAKARDLWQSPLLPLQHLTACVAAGASALMLTGVYAPLHWTAALWTVAHLILVGAEVLMPHPTAHARLAVREMVRGRYRIEFAAGVILQLLGLINLPFRPEAAAFILLGLLLYEHAHVGAGQAVPLA
jgi:hypothetical protein